MLKEGDRDLVRKVGVQGKQKLKDIWDNHPYSIKRKIAPDIPVYEVHMEATNKKTRTLHRNMLLPFYGVPDPEDAEFPPPKRRPKKIQSLRAAKSFCPVAIPVTKKETIEKNSHKQFLGM